jgi:hypothetical protein
VDAPEPEPDAHAHSQAKGKTIILRWWHEPKSAGEEEQGLAIRGTVRELTGRTLGAFAGFENLSALLRRILGSDYGGPHDRA